MRNLLLQLIFLLPILSFGQTGDETYKFGPAINNVKGYSYPGLYMHSEYNTFSFNNPAIVVSVRILGSPINPTVRIQRFDQKNLTELSSSTYNDFERASFVAFTKTKDAVFLLYCIQYGSEVYIRKIDITTGTMGEATLLFKGPELALTASSSGPINMFTLSTSLDSSKILISYILKPRNSNNSVNYIEAGYHVYSNTMEKLWAGIVKMPYVESSMNKLGLTVSNQGDVYQLIFSKEFKKFAIVVVKNLTDIKVNKLEISTDLKILNANINETHSGNFSCTGLYVTGTQDRLTQGMLRFQVDKNMQIVYSKKFAIDDEFAKATSPIKVIVNASQNADIKNNGMLYLTLFKVNEYADGTSLIISEQLDISVVTARNIVLIKIDKSGTVLWMVKLPKPTGKLEKCGRVYDIKESLYFLLLDEKNLVSYKINSTTGDFTSQNILTFKDQDVWNPATIIYDLTMIEEKTFISSVLTKKADQTRLIRIKIK